MVSFEVLGGTQNVASLSRASSLGPLTDFYGCNKKKLISTVDQIEIWNYAP